MEAKKWEHQKDCRGKLRKPQNVTKAYSSNYLLNSFSSPQIEILYTHCSFQHPSHLICHMHMQTCRKMSEIHPTYKRNHKEGGLLACLEYVTVTVS